MIPRGCSRCGCGTLSCFFVVVVLNVELLISVRSVGVPEVVVCTFLVPSGTALAGALSTS